MMKKLKYLFITLMLALVGFLAFSIRNYLPVLALGNVSIQDNDTFSNDILIDMDYYNSLDSATTNLISCPTSAEATNDWQAKLLCYSRIDNNTTYYYNAVYNKSGGNGNGGMAIYLTQDIPPTTLDNWFPNTPTNATRIAINEDANANIHLNVNSGNYNYIAFYIGRTNDTSRKNFTNIQVSLYDFNKTDYVAYYRNMFGFSIYSSDSAVTSCLDYVETINNKNYYYLPFDISENGKISFQYTFPPGASVNFHKIVVNNKINGFSNNKLKLKYYYSNFSLGYKSISFADIDASASDYWYYGLIFQSDSPQVIIQSGKHSVYYSNWKNEIYNFINQDDFIDAENEWIQVLGFNSAPDDVVAYRTISFESLVCSSFGSGGGTYIPDNSSNDYESYLPVSGPFDLVPILTNAFTWIIYNVPIIGPIVNLFRSARVMFTSVVSLGELFSGFGIIFSIFIICLILYIIKKLYGGDN